MEGEEEVLGPPKRVAPLSTVSLDSTYDRDDGNVEKVLPCTRCSWTPIVGIVGLVLLAVGLVLALDRDGSSERGADPDEGDPTFSMAYASLMSGDDLTAPQQKLVEWYKQMRNASELYVEGNSRNMSLTGVLFPRTGSDSSLPFDAMIIIDSGVTMPSRQYVALANGRGYKWVVTSLDYGNSVVTNGCLAGNVVDGLDLVVKTANWTTSNDKSHVTVVFNGEKYTVAKEEDDYDDSSETEDTRCWLVEREADDFGLRVCTLSLGDLLPKTDYAELFNATSGCSELALKTTRTMSSVPLPLRKWYASYKM